MADIPITAFPQNTRFQVYSLFDNALAKHRHAFLDLGDDFLIRYCHLIEKEKDPRNLLLVFGITKVLLLEFPVKNVIEVIAFDISS